jgi:hypothetical protein
MLARLGEAIYLFGCLAAAVIVLVGAGEYWFGQGHLDAFMSWLVFAAIAWLIGRAARYVLTGRI